jgi:hypothetical protein
MDNDDPLAKFRGVLPSRAELCQLVLFGTSEKIRAAAQSVLDLLPPMTAKEKENWSTAVWQSAKLPSESDLEKSPIGRQTLAMLRANQPVGVEKKVESGVNVSPVDSEPITPVEAISATPEQPPDDGVNDYLKKLSWPPKSTPTKPVDDGAKHMWVAGTPSKPDKSLRQLPPDLGENEPIY